MRSRGNYSEKALNASESYAQRREEEIRKYFFFKLSWNWKLSCPGKVCKDSIKVIQGCADDLFESFPFVLRIVNCNVRHHGNIPGSTAIFSLERSRVMQRHHIRWEKVWLLIIGTNCFYHGNYEEFWKNIMKTIWLLWELITCVQLYMASQKSFLIPIYWIAICLIINRMLKSF